MHHRASLPMDPAPDRSWVSAAKSRDWFQTMKPWSSFAGLSERHPYTLPSTVDWELRGESRFPPPCARAPLGGMVTLCVAMRD